MTLSCTCAPPGPRSVVLLQRMILATASIAAMAGAATAAEPASPGQVDFEVLRGGDHFGDQSVEVTRTANGVVAHTSADLRAGLGPLTLFHYAQDCRETWTGDVLAGLDCETLKNGKRTKVDAKANGKRSFGFDRKERQGVSRQRPADKLVATAAAGRL